MLVSHTKADFGSSIAFFGKSQQLVRWLSSQISSLRMGTHQSFFFNLRTLKLHHRIYGILTDGILNLEVVSKFYFYWRKMKNWLIS